MCGGAKVTQAERQRHEAQDRRERSLLRPTLASSSRVLSQPAHAPAAFRPPATACPVAPAAPAPAPAYPHQVPMQPADDQWQPVEPSALTLAAEAAGRDHAHQVAESGELFLPISDNNWETADSQVEDVEQPIDDGVEGPSPATYDENNPDPFYFTPSGAQPLPTAADIHPNPAVYLIYVVVLWLHTSFHLPFRACNALLTIFALTLKAGNAPITPAIHTTLPSVINKLGAEPTIQILPVCPKCFEVYPVSTAINALCSRCSHPLFPNTPSPSQRRRGHTVPQNPRPHLQFPTKSLAEQLAVLLAAPGMEDEIEESLGKAKSRVPGKWTNIFDGKVCQELPTAEGSRFFFPSEEEVANGELRIGVTMGVDWFSYLRSQISASHTSCPMSYSIINLLAHHRYIPHFVPHRQPSPGGNNAWAKGSKSRSVPTLLRPLINKLLRLWKDGVVIVTPKYPQGRLVRVALVAVVCDKPAAHKLGGFGSHSHTNFCTMCWISQEFKASPNTFKENGFEERTDARHRELQKEYLKCTSKSARDAFVKKYATRWSELHRLPYFNLCEMIVIDPMHNLFLGVVKTHFYHIWVQLNVLRKTKELRSLHTILSKLQLPAHLGRLPSLIGEPAGGSLTADQWLNFCTIVAPLAIPQLWQQYISDESPTELAARCAKEISTVLEEKRAAAVAARQAAAAPLEAPAGKRVRKPTAKAAEMDIDPDETNGLDAGANDSDSDDDDYGLNLTQQRRRKRARKTASTEAEDEERDNATPPNLHPDDPANFLKLCTAIKILVLDTITENSLQSSDELLRAYCQELVDLYGSEVIHPNHHYATHTSRCVCNYGPLREFWTFLFECLNKVLKSYKTPNHAGGELEASFFREFQRTVQNSRLLAQGAREPLGSELRDAVDLMYRATDNDRGTVQALARDLDSVNLDAGVIFQLSPQAENGKLPLNIYTCVLQHLQIRLTHVQLHSYLSISPSPESRTLFPNTLFFDYAVVRNRRYLASHRSSTNASSLIAVHTSSAPGANLWLAELLSVFAIKQDTIGTQKFSHVRWFRPSTTSLTGTIWADFAPLSVRVWSIDEYLTAADDGPEPLIELSDIVCHVVRMDVIIRGQHHWATILAGKFLQPH
ncbi:hypothetical protein C8R43DRAFT_1120617 [Mycena crocata]|nr:hypothetical protein C8R43DRAFT_1120617 [Mycena crocata]